MTRETDYSNRTSNRNENASESFLSPEKNFKIEVNQTSTGFSVHK